MVFHVTFFSNLVQQLARTFCVLVQLSSIKIPLLPVGQQQEWGEPPETAPEPSSRQ